MLRREELAARIDHTLLKPEATPQAVERLCREAVRWRFCAVCVNPVFVPLAARELAGTGVRVAAVVGFPLGATTALVKAVEAAAAVAAGAAEIDMVGPVGLLLGGDERAWAEHVRAVRQAVGPSVVLKVILETGLLDDRQKRLAARIAVDEGAQFVKTSTGFGPTGATVEDVRLLAEAVAGRARVKASGGIRTPDDARRLIEAGADRLGTSASVAIMEAMAGAP